MLFNEIANYDFISPAKTCQRHLEIRAEIIWDLVQTNESAVDIRGGE